MREPPPEVVASWPKPNYVNPEYQGPQLIILGFVLVSISCVVVGIRLFVRLHMKKSAGWDDWLVAATLPFLGTIAALSCFGVHHGWGHHKWDFRPEWKKPLWMSKWFGQLFSLWVITLVKLSILASYLRLSACSKTLRRATWALIFVIILWGIAFTFTLFFACIPLSQFWNKSSKGKCTNESSRVLAGAITNVLTDFLVFALPIPTLWKLRLPIREKLILVILMSLGLIVCAASVMWAYYLYAILHLTYDVTWVGYNVCVWRTVEANLAVICASIPMLRPFARRYLPGMHFKSSRSASASSLPMEIQHPGAYMQRTLQQSMTAISIDDEETSLEGLTDVYPRAILKMTEVRDRVDVYDFMIASAAMNSSAPE